MTPIIGSPSPRARSSFLRNTNPTPSPRQYPSPLASKGFVWPVGLKKFALMRFSHRYGLVQTFTPPARAADTVPALIALQAASMATDEARHAVSNVIEGPVHPQY